MHAAEGKAVTLVCRVYSNPLARVCIMIEDTMKLIEGDQIHILDDHDVLDVDADHVDHDNYLSDQVLWYKDTMKLIEGDRIHMASVGNTYKLSIAGFYIMWS